MAILLCWMNLVWKWLRRKQWRLWLTVWLADASALLLLAERDEYVDKSVRNLPQVKALRASYLNIRDLLGYDKIVMPLSSLEANFHVFG